MSLKSKLALRLVLTLLLVAALIFAPAGSFGFWQGWMFLGTFAVLNLVSVAYFYRRDPRLLERRLQNREPRSKQRIFRMLWVLIWLCIFVLPGLDYRFGWSAALLGGVPLWLTIISLVLFLSSWLLLIQVLRYNSFASAIIQVEAGQRVITDGPYRVVRHPMYTGFVLTILVTPFLLGSYVAFVPALLLIPALVFRLRDEERVLRQELSGYAEYCEHTRFRLIPSVY